MQTSNEKHAEMKQVVPVSGNLTASNVPDFRAQLKGVLATGTTDLIMDMTNTHVIDSTGIGMIVAAHNSMKKMGGRLSLVNVPRELLELLKAFRLDKHFSISGDASGDATRN